MSIKSTSQDPKREIFEILYADLNGKSVLDVGCGEFNYMLPAAEYEGVDLKFGMDWYDHKPGNYDVIIANDLFPNVDQRLELFLDKYLPHCKEMRLSLTYFDEPKWYRAKRIDGDEILTVAAWNKERLELIIWRLGPHENGDDVIEDYQGIFPNGRKVLLVWLMGGLA